MGEHHQFFEGLNRTRKVEEGGACCFCFLPAYQVGTSVFPCPWTGTYSCQCSWFSGLWTQITTAPLAFLVLQLMDGQLWDLASIATGANSHNKTFYMFISYWFCFSEEFQYRCQWRRSSVLRIRPWDFPGGPVVKTLPSSAENVGLIPGQGAKILHTLRPKYQSIKQKQYYNKFIKTFKTLHVKES